jgi:hypothetical protein
MSLIILKPGETVIVDKVEITNLDPSVRYVKLFVTGPGNPVYLQPDLTAQPSTKIKYRCTNVD